MIHPVELEFGSGWYRERAKQLQKQAEQAALVREARKVKQFQPSTLQHWFGLILIKWGRQLLGHPNTDLPQQEFSVEMLNKISIKISL
jgi:hypothetical protein